MTLVLHGDAKELTDWALVFNDTSKKVGCAFDICYDFLTCFVYIFGSHIFLA